MIYANYDTAIVVNLGIMLVNWPPGVKFTNPSEIGAIADLIAIRDALKTGACFWKTLTKNEISEYKAKIEERRKQDGTAPKARKKRSDAGRSKPRGQENRRPAAKGKTPSVKSARAQQKSPEFVLSDEEDEVADDAAGSDSDSD